MKPGRSCEMQVSLPRNCASSCAVLKVYRYHCTLVLHPLGLQGSVPSEDAHCLLPAQHMCHGLWQVARPIAGGPRQEALCNKRP